MILARILTMMATAGLCTSPAGADLDALVRECESCHGLKGVSLDADIPTIAGQSAGLIEKALEQFRSMGRPCKRTGYRHGAKDRPRTTMCSVSANLEDSEVTALAAHFSAQEFVPAAQEFDESMAVTGASLHGLYCESCHPGGGSESGYAGRLAGQWTPYLKRTIVQITNSELLVPHMMERKLKTFSAQEIDALLNFWASQQD